MYVCGSRHKDDEVDVSSSVNSSSSCLPSQSE